MINAYTGELAGLSAACLWALAAVVYFQVGKHVPPLALNLYKGVIASALLTITLAVRGELGDTLDASAVLWLLASGAVGIGVGDTAFFAALNRLGERRTVLMAETLAPPITTLFAIVALAEMLPPLAFVGMALTIAGVAWVIVEKGARAPDYPFDGARLRAGIVWATTAALCQAVGAVTSRGVLTQTDTGPLWSALIRMLGGVAILLLWLPATRRPFFPAAARNLRVWRWILVAAFLGTYLGIFLQQLALQHTDAGVAQTLLATSSLFVLPLVIARGESVSAQAACGAAAAVCGVALLFAAS